VKRIDERDIELEHRLAPSDHDQPLILPVAPQLLDKSRQLVRLSKLAPAFAVGADKIGIAKPAFGGRPILLATGPQIAPRKAQEHRAATGLNALSLQRQETFLDRVGHA
jgi:hypothetical protein